MICHLTQKSYFCMFSISAMNTLPSDMIIDALTDNPLVITGSANFSAASTDKVRWI